MSAVATRRAVALGALFLLAGGVGYAVAPHDAAWHLPAAAAPQFGPSTPKALAKQVPEPKPPTQTMDLRHLVGQKLMVAFRNESAPPPALLRQIRRGRVGGVILFAENASPRSHAGFARVTATLQKAARAGHNPPLLIATDQEGGPIRRLPGPPELSGAQMGARSATSVRAMGRRTGRYLRGAGINVDLAPVADTPSDPSSFLGTRAFGTSPRTVSTATTSFVAGLQAEGITATAKHYPGLGRSGPANTDTQRVVIAASRRELDRDRAPFRDDVAAHVGLVMISSATYPAYDANHPAVMSPRVIRMLRREDRFQGVTISDDLDALSDPSPAVGATKAGVDMLLFDLGGGVEARRALLREAKSGRLPRATLEEQVGRILLLKQRVNAQRTP